MATFCLSGSVVLKAGANVSTAIVDSQYNEWIEQAEANINSEVKYPDVNLVTDFSNMATGVKEILEDAASSHAAMAAINYDMGAYDTIEQAQTMQDFNYTRYKDAIARLKEKSVIDFIRSFNT